jgi:CheY-like chemotaxis protein
VDDQRLILVVEDDEATRKFLLDNLAADGFRVAGASSAGEGLRAIEVRQPNLVVLDLALEDSSGLDLLDRLRAADGLASRLDPDLPVIVLTGRAGEADRVQADAFIVFRAVEPHLRAPRGRRVCPAPNGTVSESLRSPRSAAPGQPCLRCLGEIADHL